MVLSNRNIEAPAFALLIGQTACWSCAAATRVAALWVPSHAYWHEPDWEPDHEPDPALLGFVEAVSDGVMDQVTRHAPWMAFVTTKTAGFTYLGNPCESCEAVQGDHYLRRPGEVFFPETPAQLGAMRFVLGDGALQARGAISTSSWMSKLQMLADSAAKRSLI